MSKLKELQEIGVKLYSLADKFIELHGIAVELQNEFANTCVTAENFDEYVELYGLLGDLALALNIGELANHPIRKAYIKAKDELTGLIRKEREDNV